MLKRRSPQRASIFVEMAVTIPIFMMVVVVLIDISRYFFVHGMLMYAVERGASVASRTEIETVTNSAANLSEKGCQAAIQSPDECTKYLERVAAILEETRRYSDLVAGVPSSSSSTKYRMFNHYTPATRDSRLLARGSFLQNVPVAFLRPGEQVQRVSPLPGQPEFVNHPTRPYAPGPTPGTGWPFGGESWATVLDIDPILVHLEATYEPLTPLLPRKLIVAEAMSFRRVQSYRPAPPADATVAPTATPPHTPTPTITPVNTATPDPSIPTATATTVPTAAPQTPTPVPSATHTPWPICFSCAAVSVEMRSANCSPCCRTRCAAVRPGWCDIFCVSGS